MSKTDIVKWFEKELEKQFKKQFGDKPFPHTIVLECGCEKTYNSMQELIKDVQRGKCKHGEFFAIMK